MADPPPAPDRGVYAISVATELLGVGVQTLRLYEARGRVLDLEDENERLRGER